MKVNIYFMRHGFSCANAISKYARYIYRWKLITYLDPPLTNISKKQISKYRYEFPQNIDIVASSVLLRAIQTALYSYPNKTVFPLPFISELGTGLGQHPSSPEHQKQILGSRMASRVDYRFVTPPDNPNIFFPDVGQPNYEKFLQYLGRFLPFIMKASGLKSKKHKSLNMLVVTHSLFMRENFGVRKVRLPHNNAILLKQYLYGDGKIQEKPCSRKRKSFSTVDENLQCGGMVHAGFAPPSSKEEYKEQNGHEGCMYDDIF